MHIREFGRRCRRVTIGISAALLLLGLTIPSPPASADDLKLSLQRLGQVASITFTPSADGSSTADVAIPVPSGVRPDRLTGTLDVSGDAVDGVLQASLTDGRRVTSIDLGTSAGHSVPVSIALGSVPSTDSTVRLTLQIWPRYGRCRPVDATGSVLRSLAVTFHGKPSAPKTLADFLPAGLSAADIVVPDDPSASVGTGAIRLATALAARYAPAKPRITVRSASDHFPTPTGLGREIVFTGKGNAAMKLQGDHRQLAISGSGDQLIAQVAALTSDLTQIAAGVSVSASGASTVPTQVARTQTLDQLDIGSLTSSGTSTATVHIGVPGARVGGTGGGWQLHLVGSVLSDAQPSQDDRQGTLTLSADGDVLQSWPLSSGSWDLTPTIPAGQIGRFTDLTLTATTYGGAGCGSGSHVELHVTGASTLTVESGGPTVALTQLPALLQPRFVIASAQPTVAGLADSANMAVTLQRLTGAPLAPEWQPDLTKASQSRRPVVLLAGTTPVPHAQQLPARLSTKGITVPGGRTLAGQLDAAVLQVGRVDGHIMVVRQGTNAKIDGLFATWLAQADHLADLTGTAAVWTGTGSATSFGTGLTPTAPKASAPAGVPKNWLYLVGGAAGGAVVVAGVILAATMLRRRRRPASSASRDTRGDDS